MILGNDQQPYIEAEDESIEIVDDSNFIGVYINNKGGSSKETKWRTVLVKPRYGKAP